MCGITGFWGPPDTAQRLQSQLDPMIAALHHRGPDDHGAWVDPASGIALGQTRLAIVDLSAAGHQPMTSECRRFQVVFNGEIYNHAQLREQLRQFGATFRGQSDTEVLIAGFRHWGVRSTIERSVGMFAIAVWDIPNGELTLIRDRLGIKPLYYSIGGTPSAPEVMFASELKAFRARAGWSGQINRQAVAGLLRWGYVPSPLCIEQGVQMLRPGMMLRIQGGAKPLQQRDAYWSFAETAETATESIDPAEDLAGAAQRVEAVLSEAIRLRMVADVPLGAFLSGGIDSSLVVALMQQQATQPVRTLTIGFEDPAYDEAPAARAIAQHLGTSHTEHYVTADEARAVIPQLPELFDEPFADSSQIPMYLVCKLARQNVTVCLSGDGGDELFCGYRRYFPSDGISRWMSRVPGWARPAMRGLARLGAGGLRRVGGGGTRVERGLSRLASSAQTELASVQYLANLSHWTTPGLVLGIDTVETNPLDEPDRWPSELSPPESWMWYDTQRYLPDDILTKVDRASMAVGLEARVPLLDHRVVAAAWSTSLKHKRDGQTGKRVLREILSRYVPRPLFERPKMGFGVPLAAWLRGPLQSWANDLLSVELIQRQGILNPEPITALWQRHRTGQSDESYRLWTVLMFQAWLLKRESGA